MHLPTLKAKKCRRASQDDTVSLLVSSNPLEILSRSQSTRIVTGQQAGPFPAASTETGHHEEEALILDDKTSHEVNTPINVRRTDDKDKNVYRCAVLPDYIAVWYLKGTGVSLSALAATVLASEGLIKTESVQM